MLSIIIPVYNSSEYLEECLSSLENQNINIDHEIIISYDKSSDNSLEIIKRHQDRNKNIILLKNNDRAGILNARINALRMAKGDYVTFMDADDFIKNNAFSMIRKITTEYNPDVISFSFETLNNGKIRKYPFSKNSTINGSKANSMLQKDASMRGFLWQKVYKKSLLMSKPIIYYDDKDAMFEDVCLNFSLFIKADKVITTKQSYYVYRIDNHFSGTSCPRIDRLDKHILSFDLEKRFSELINRPDLTKILIKHIWRHVLSLRYDAKRDAKNGGRSLKESKKIIKQWKKDYKKKSNPGISALDRYIFL